MLAGHSWGGMALATTLEPLAAGCFHGEPAREYVNVTLSPLESFFRQANEVNWLFCGDVEGRAAGRFASFRKTSLPVF